MEFQGPYLHVVIFLLGGQDVYSVSSSEASVISDDPAAIGGSVCCGLFSEKKLNMQINRNEYVMNVTTL